MNSPAWLDRLERRFGHWAIPDLAFKLMILKLMVYGVVMIYGPGFLINAYNQAETAGFGLPAAWGLVVLAPPGLSQDLDIGFLWNLLCCYFTFVMGRMVESHLGSFRFGLFNLVYFLMLGTSTFLLFSGGGNLAANSGFLAEASRAALYMLIIGTLMPHMEFLVFFVLPVRARILAIIDGLMLLGYAVLALPLSPVLSSWIACPLYCYALCLGLPMLWYRFRAQARQAAFEGRARGKLPPQAATSAAKAKSAVFHRCEVCGVTDADDRDLDFRVGADGRDYCEKHLR